MYLRLGFQSRSHIEVQLAKEDCTLEDILEEDDVVQESKAHNTKLIAFFARKDNLEKIIQFVSTEQKLKEKKDSDSEEDEIQVAKGVQKYPQICCDIICSENDIIYDEIVADQNLLKTIFSYLSTTDHIYSNFLSTWLKLITNLFEKRPKEILAFVKAHDEVVEYFTKHIGFVEILELLLRFLGLEPNEDDQDPNLSGLNLGFGQFKKQDKKIEIDTIDIGNWFLEKKFIEQVLDKLDVKFDPEIHTNVTYIFAEILIRSTKQGEKMTPLTNYFLSKDMITIYCNKLVSNPNTSIMTEGIALLSYILEVSFSFGYKEKVPDAVQVILDHLGHFAALLTNPPKTDPIETTFAKLDPPLGLTRLKIIEFLVQLFRVNSPQVESELIRNNILGVILDLCFLYEYNNLLHNLFLTLMTFILGGESSDIKKALFVDYKICDRIITLFADNKVQMEKTRMGKGFMGHLTITANTIESVSKSHTLIESFVKDNTAWHEFVSKELAARNSLEIHEGSNYQDQKEDIEKQFQDFENDDDDEEFGDEDFKKGNNSDDDDDSDDEVVRKPTQIGDLDDDEEDDETMIRHGGEEKDNTYIKPHDAKLLNSFVVWRLENEANVEQELK
jgi:serine/threonine-protein phosphatase 6 regulatory subunit 3